MANTTIELKYNLMQLIMQMEDPSFLKEVKSFIIGQVDSDYDWADELTEDQIQSILIGKEQIRNGEHVSSEEVHLGFKKMIEQKDKEA